MLSTRLVLISKAEMRKGDSNNYDEWDELFLHSPLPSAGLLTLGYRKEQGRSAEPLPGAQKDICQLEQTEVETDPAQF